MYGFIIEMERTVLHEVEEIEAASEEKVTFYIQLNAVSQEAAIEQAKAYADMYDAKFVKIEKVYNQVF